MVSDKVFFFWSLVFPMLFIVLFGLLFKASDNAPAVAELTVVNLDQGRWGTYFLGKIKAPTIDLKIVESEPAEYSRLIVLPADFSARIEAKARPEAGLQEARGRLDQGGRPRRDAALSRPSPGRSASSSSTETATSTKFLDGHAEFRDIVQVKSRFPENTVTVVPSGFDHSIPGTTIQFIMMMVIIYGGITVMEDRKKGVLARMLFSPLSKGEVFQAKLLGRWAMGLLQALILIVVGQIFFKLNLGSLPLALLVIAVFALAMAALSVFIGSLCTKEDMIIGLAVLLANIFAGLGGCWWPSEIVPLGVRKVAMISPAYWAMDALHKLRFFQGGFGDILLNLGILAALAIGLGVVAARAFKIRD
ncbi:MAG: ABC transporter permease [Desulfosudis oleivorans]|nr:ABC transporter permease [Desulfosudis oleivorans]